MSSFVRPALASDGKHVAQIYNHYIEHSVATFEEVAVSVSEIRDRMAEHGPWLVAESGGEVAGYAYAAPFKSRSAYRYSREVTVYMAPQCTASGIGTALYGQLFSELRATDCHSVIAGITLPNAPSVALHEKFGMQQVAHFSEVGYKLGQWLDVGYWQARL